MNKSILVALCGALTLGIAPGCEDDLREDAIGTARAKLVSGGDADETGETARERGDEPAPEATPDDEPVDPVLAPDEQPTPDDENLTSCWRTCVEIAFPALTTCRDAIDASDEACFNEFYDAVYRCGAGCATADVEGDPELAPTGIYRGYFCDGQPFIETQEIPEAEALANCQLNAASNPVLQVYCTWNDAVLFDGCDASSGTDPAPEVCEGWEASSLERAQEFIDTTYWSAEEMDCDGPSFRRFDARYGLWLGLVSCGSGYRFFLSETADGPYLPAADYGGHGQDLCELVDPSFSIPNEDDITSGGCSACAISTNYSFIAGEVFARGAFGQPFARTEAPSWGSHQSAVIRCASGPVECGLAED
jgi:hypothetical protein